MVQCCILPMGEKQVLLIRLLWFSVHPDLVFNVKQHIVNFNISAQVIRVWKLHYITLQTNCYFKAFQFDLIWEQKILSLVPKNYTNTNNLHFQRWGFLSQEMILKRIFQWKNLNFLFLRGKSQVSVFLHQVLHVPMPPEKENVKNVFKM